jgi:hypothetical protein
MSGVLDAPVTAPGATAFEHMIAGFTSTRTKVSIHLKVSMLDRQQIGATGAPTDVTRIREGSHRA